MGIVGGSDFKKQLEQLGDDGIFVGLMPRCMCSELARDGSARALGLCFQREWLGFLQERKRTSATGQEID